jgi:23S rRNA pseudouridine1911/1915/1917 synthase
MGTTPIILKVARAEVGCDLHTFLVRRMRLTGRAAKRLLDDHSVFVNNRRTWMGRHPLAAGDRVEVQEPPGAAVSGPAEAPLLYQDDHFVIVDKPSGQLANGPASLETALRRRAGLERLAAVHRLDRDTSGCMLFARHEKARLAAVGLFESLAVRKTYLAIATGRVPAALREIREPIDGEPALTRLRILRATHEATLLSIALQTGRTHQIRKHLASAGHPLVGDRVYATGETASETIRRAGRQMLHAQRLAFDHPFGKGRVEVASEPPADFRRCLKALNLG